MEEGRKELERREQVKTMLQERLISSENDMLGLEQVRKELIDNEVESFGDPYTFIPKRGLVIVTGRHQSEKNWESVPDSVALIPAKHSNTENQSGVEAEKGSDLSQVESFNLLAYVPKPVSIRYAYFFRK